MRSMAGIFRYWHVCALLALGLACTTGCERSQPDQPANSSSADTRQTIPFHEGGRLAPPTNAETNRASTPGSPGHVPFRGTPSQVVPAGTLVTVQLQHTLSSTRIHAGDTFTAVLAAPLTLNGNVLIDRGATVTVKVESAKSRRYQPGYFAGSGYIGLSLSAVDVEGKQVVVQTSSLFERGLLQKPAGVRIPKGHDLTFRLTAPFALDQSEVLAGHQAGTSNTD
jgi:hypothetical protein